MEKKLICVIICFSDYGQYKVEAKTKTSSGVEFTSNGSSSHDSGAFTGSLETKYKWSDHGERLNPLGGLVFKGLRLLFVILNTFDQIFFLKTLLELLYASLTKL